MPTPLSAKAAKTLIDKLLDQGFTRATNVVITAMNRSLKSGIMAERTKQWLAETKRLADAGMPVTRDNPVLRALLADLESELKRAGVLIDSASGVLQDSAIQAASQIVRQLALPDTLPAAIRARWNVPDPEAVARAVNFTDSAAWKARLADYSASTIRAIQDAAIRGIVGGQSPLRIGSTVARLTGSMPLYQAQSLMRTLQLTAYRGAAVANGLANADILSGQIRIAVLDRRTCMACVALHGTPLGLGDRVNDHDQGRCTSVYVVKGRAIAIEPGTQWFDRQSSAVQSAMMGPAAYAAWTDGVIKLPDFVQPYQDAVFGEMVREASLTGMLGPQAAQYLKNRRASA